MKRINKNSKPFILLSIIHLLLLLLTLIKKRERRTLILLLSNISFAYIFEYFVFNVFESYRYNPKILKKRQLDNALGALLSQAIYVPISATFLTAFGLGWIWKVIFTAYFHVIEIHFLNLNNYKLHWWKPIYTTLLLPVYFNISDFWDKNLALKKKSFYWLSTYLSSGVVAKTLFFTIDVYKKQKIGLGRFHTWKEHFLISPLYMFIFSAIAILPAIKNKLSVKALTFLLMMLMNYLLACLKIINKSSTFVQVTLQNIFMIYLTPLIKSYIFEKKKTETT
ncbi:hypothetical protein D3H55_03035 [Bacillus salacetis]|uniref:Uncharacterized protein n=1 Tax=Bacillus salacetis TaxID=2315464 RepID=A0A3A1R5P9_9BACI|nr:hypothetical protein [Bacillus salacetis]RIW38526.1 hypothetical protein D3H55_03035 [Bacillus salacetis]